MTVARCASRPRRARTCQRSQSNSLHREQRFPASTFSPLAHQCASIRTPTDAFSATWSASGRSRARWSRSSAAVSGDKRPVRERKKFFPLVQVLPNLLVECAAREVALDPPCSSVRALSRHARPPFTGRCWPFVQVLNSDMQGVLTPCLLALAAVAGRRASGHGGIPLVQRVFTLWLIPGCPPPAGFRRVRSGRARRGSGMESASCGVAQVQATRRGALPSTHRPSLRRRNVYARAVVRPARRCARLPCRRLAGEASPPVDLRQLRPSRKRSRRSSRRH
jgi:hypothetical protein